jgi:hypothetical protein
LFSLLRAMSLNRSIQCREHDGPPIGFIIRYLDAKRSKICAHDLLCLAAGQCGYFNYGHVKLPQLKTNSPLS